MSGCGRNRAQPRVAVLIRKSGGKRGYPTPGVLPPRVCKVLKTREITDYQDPRVRKFIKTLELGDLFHFGTAFCPEDAYPDKTQRYPESIIPRLSRGS